MTKKKYDEDPLLELRRVREEHAKECNYNLKKMIETTRISFDEFLKENFSTKPKFSLVSYNKSKKKKKRTVKV